MLTTHLLLTLGSFQSAGGSSHFIAGSFRSTLSVSGFAPGIVGSVALSLSCMMMKIKMYILTGLVWCVLCV